MKIYTKTGDAGETSLFDKSRVSKADARVDAYGEVDELNATLGAARAAGLDDELAVRARGDSEGTVRRRSETGGSGEAHRRPRHEGGGPGVRRRAAGAAPSIGSKRELEPLRRFILPGGALPGALLHVSRTICRRAERRVVGLGPDAVEPIVIVYLNRLSDLLFVMARAANRRAGVAETEW